MLREYTGPRESSSSVGNYVDCITKLQEEDRKWHELWKVEEIAPDYQTEVVRIREVITVKQIQEAARSFKDDTSNNEGLAVKQIGFLHENAQEVLGCIMVLAEIWGKYPDVLEANLVKLIGKKDGGASTHSVVPQHLQSACED